VSKGCRCCVLIVLLVSLVMLLAGSLYLHSRSSPFYRNSTWLINTASLIEGFEFNHGRWPSNISECLQGQRLEDSFSVDYYGQPVVYRPFDEADGFGVLISYGRDGVVGGAFFNRDIEIRFPLESNWTWNVTQSRPTW
jgi:hypothetical protein